MKRTRPFRLIACLAPALAMLLLLAGCRGERADVWSAIPKPTRTEPVPETTREPAVTLPKPTAVPTGTPTAPPARTIDSRIADYLSAYGSMPPFERIGDIDKNWVLETFFLNAHYLDSYIPPDIPKEYEAYGFVRLFMVEYVARKTLNPDVDMPADYEYDAMAVNHPLIWLPEQEGFVWLPSGGGYEEYDYLNIDITQKNGVFEATALEILIVWDDEYESINGKAYVGNEQVGTAAALYDSETGDCIRIDYTFTTGVSRLPRRTYVLEENGDGFIIHSKT